MSSGFLAAVAARAADAKERAPITFVEELQRCAKARRAQDYAAVLRTARAILRAEPQHPVAWAYLCWALFQMKRYADAKRQCWKALSQRSWSMRDREGMNALMARCDLLQALSGSSVGDKLRSGWYATQLISLLERSGTELTTDDGAGAVVLGPTGDVDSIAAHGCSFNTGWVHRGISPGTLKGYPFDQAYEGFIFLKERILPTASFDSDDYDQFFNNALNRRRRGAGARCRVYGVAAFPRWVLPASTDVLVPEHDEARLTSTGYNTTPVLPQLDVFYSTTLLSAATRARLRVRLDELAKTCAESPAPMYHNVVDPNVGSAISDGELLWVPTDVQVSEVDTVTYETVLALELAAKALTGSTLPFGLALEVLLLAGLGHKRARCCISSPIADLDPHDHSQLYLALQELLTAALPLLARLCQPALLLPGPLQVVVKAQRLVLGAGESYEGVWHEDGLREHIVAVVLYYYRVSAGLSGGNLEFCSEATEVFEAEGGSYQADLVRQWLQHGIRRCQVPVEEGTLLVFSNYAAVHRVLTMVAQQEGGSRDFVAFFVVDQRVPLPSPPLAEREVRLQQREQLMAEQLQPHGKFGLDQADVYGTGLRRGSNLTTRRPTSSLTLAHHPWSPIIVWQATLGLRTSGGCAIRTSAKLRRISAKSSGGRSACWRT
jgi:hypothetical protein